MDRSRFPVVMVLVGGLLLGSTLATLSGCAANALATAWWVVKGTNTTAEFDGLKGKRVAVVCRPPASLHYSTTSSARELGSEVSRLLRANVKKIDMIDPREVAKWTDSNTWNEPAEIGAALDADMVVSLELEDFRLYEGQTLYRGKATVSIRVFDLSKDDSLVFDKLPDQIIYPLTTGIPTTDKQESYFRREFIRSIADQVARTFYDYDSKDYFAPDSKAFQ